MPNPHDQQRKANFDDVYDLPDPRGYFATLAPLGYEAPEHGRRIFSTLLRALGKKEGGSHKVLDLCCSYGVNAALLKHDLALRDLYERYASPNLAGFSAEELAASDVAFYASHRKASPPRVVGLDLASNAVSYALRAGVLDAGAVENLEEDEPTEALRRAARGAGLVTVTGGVGYIRERTFERVLSCIMDDPAGGEPEDQNAPWFAAFALRFADYAPIAAVLARRGLVTEKLSVRTFPQRRFENDGERAHAFRRLAEAGVDPSGKEESGWYYADLYLSRPRTPRRSPWTSCWLHWRFRALERAGSSRGPWRRTVLIEPPEDRREGRGEKQTFDRSQHGSEHGTIGARKR